ncbi:MAG: DUF3226 domain-containing protein [Romboutsia sp.]|uniref:DUF3226 domain-containing protein n=1 Tax=Romboutsia sp. TaxID=1965302 RepID=UPI003F2E26F7
MNSIILCEGKVDAILISYYLEKVHGWQYNKKKPPVKINIINNENEEANWYTLNDKKLCIWAIGGVSNFKHNISEIIKINKLAGEDNQSFNKVIIISDRDDEENNENIISDFNNMFTDNKINIELEMNNITNTTYINDFDDEININVGIIVVPKEGRGAIETFLLDALSENEAERYIVNKSKAFIESIESSKYLNRRREKVKAELGVTFALISPDKVFTPLHNLLCEVNWDEYTNIQQGFKILENL